MPPKPSKAAQKQKEKKVEDKTFGLKNKNKSKKVQQYVNQVKEQMNQTHQKRKPEVEGKKELERKKKEELNEIFKPVITQQKVPFGVDPKTILCQFFKHGQCTRGKNCKFSHDLNIDRKSAKIDLYTDARDQGDEKEKDTMDDWDQTKLEEVVAKKHGKQNQTEIVCKFFLQAVEDRKYGWFWNCPNGDTCQYRHALPPGFVLKEKKLDTNEPVQTLEEWIEEQRANLPQKLTPITLETFQAWKQKRRDEKEKQEQEKQKQREQAIRAGKQIGASGRELFTFNPDLLQDEQDGDEEVWDIDYSEYQKNKQEEEKKEEEKFKQMQGSIDSITDLGDAIDESVFANEEDFGDLDED